MLYHWTRVEPKCNQLYLNFRVLQCFEARWVSIYVYLYICSCFPHSGPKLQDSREPNDFFHGFTVTTWAMRWFHFGLWLLHQAVSLKATSGHWGEVRSRARVDWDMHMCTSTSRSIRGSSSFQPAMMNWLITSTRSRKEVILLKSPSARSHLF